MVPMYLGLIDGPFVPRNLISTQESPVPLLKFQMAPRQNLNGHQVQERSADILFFSLKSPGKLTPSWFSNRAPMEREALLQGILHVFQIPFMFPRKGALPQDPCDGIPRREMPHH
jgi:hypothetical protein